MKRFTLVFAAMFTFVCLWGAASASAGLVPIRMTGGGWVEAPAQEPPKAFFALELQCQLGNEPNHLQLEMGKVILVLIDTTTSAFCAPNDPNDPQAGGVLRGTGKGTCNSLPVSAAWTLVDGARLLATPDSVSITVTGDSPLCNFSVSGPLGGGNLFSKFGSTIFEG